MHPTPSQASHPHTNQSIFATILAFLKYAPISQFVFGNLPLGPASSLGLDSPETISAGIDARLNYQIRIPSLRHSTAITPPPTALNTFPKTPGPEITPHPALLYKLALQSVVFVLILKIVVTEPVIFRLPSIRQVGLVYSTAEFPTPVKEGAPGSAASTISKRKMPPLY